jgi:MFS family permease
MLKSDTAREIFDLILPLYLPSFLFSFSHSLLSPVMPLYALEFNVSYGVVGLVLASEAIGMLLFDLPAGMLLRRLGQKTSMMVGLVFVGGSTAGLFWASSISMVVACRIVAGFGAAMFVVSRHFYVTEMVTPERRGRVISLFGGFFRLGRFLGPLVGGAVAAAFGLRASFLSFAGVCMVIMVVVLVFAPVLRVRQHDTRTDARRQFSYLIEMFRDQYKVLGTAGVGELFLNLTRSGPGVVIPLYGASVLGLDVQTIGNIMGLSGVVDMLLFYPAGWLMDRFGRKYAIISSCLGIGFAMLLIPLAPNAFMLSLAAMFAGLGNGLGSGTMLTLGADLAPEKCRSEFLGAWTLIGDLGGTGGPLIIGNLADYMPLQPASLVVASAGGVAALIFYLFVPETMRRRRGVKVVKPSS